MSWADVGNAVKSIAGEGLPLLGGILGGPLGAKAGSMVAKALGVADDPDAVSQALKVDPDAAVKLATIAKDERVALATLAAQTIEAQEKARASVIESVNATIRQEAAGSTWLQKVAQPLCKLATVACVIGVYFGLPLARVPVPDVPADAWLMLAAILGIAAYHDGRARRATVGDTADLIGGAVKSLTKSKH